MSRRLLPSLFVAALLLAGPGRVGLKLLPRRWLSLTGMTIRYSINLALVVLLSIELKLVEPRKAALLPVHL